MVSGIPSVTSASRSEAVDLTRWSLFGLSERRLTLLAATCFTNVVLAVMGDLLFSGSRALSAAGGGVDARFASLRAFTAGTVAEGHIPLWNPSVMSGVPHLGGFESGLYYPTSLLYRVLPLSAAINLDFAFHLFVFGMLTFVWLRRHDVHPLASVYGGVAGMLCGTFFLHAGMGDLTVLEAFAWTPAAFIAIHGLSRGHLANGVLGLTLALTLPLLCGYPMGSIYTGLAGLVYGACLIGGHASRQTMLRGALIAAVVVPLLAAVQLLPGLETFSRSVRFNGDAASHLASKAIGFRELLTAVSPWGEGSAAARPTANLFVGLVTLSAAAYGLWSGTGRLRFVWAGTAGALLLLACLPGLPAYSALLNVAPALRYVLESNLLAVPAMLFVIALACAGLDRLIRFPDAAKGFGRIAIALAAVLFFAALIATKYADGVSRGLLTGAGVMFCGAALLSLVPVRGWIRFAVIVLGVVELYVFAVVNRPTTPLETGPVVATLAVDQRVLELDWRNPAPESGVLSASGNIALPSQRYMDVLAQSQSSAISGTWNGPFAVTAYHPLHKMLRVASVTSPDGPDQDLALNEILPRFLLISDFVVARDRSEALAAMTDPEFDPWRTVVLEEPPSPRPRGSDARAAIGVSDETINALTLELKLERPAILLMTDAYDRGWRARGLMGSSQWQYEVMPANVALRAIPLGAGVHRIRLEYAPLSFRAGQWISITVATGLALFAIGMMRRRQRKSNAGTRAKHAG